MKSRTQTVSFRDTLGSKGAPWGSPGGSVGKESTCSAGDPGLIPGLGRSPGAGISYPCR